MNYLKLYVKIIRHYENNEILVGPIEKHHVFPVSIFGKNGRIVKVPVRVHFVLHQLIYMGFKKRYGEMHYRTIKMAMAFRNMSLMSKRLKNRGGYRVTSRMYDTFKRYNKLQFLGDRNPAKRPEVREKISKSKEGKERLDMKGKKYMGSELPQEVIIARSVKGNKLKYEENLKKIGKKTNYPTGRKSTSHTQERKNNMKIGIERRNNEIINYSKDEFWNWLYNVSFARNKEILNEKNNVKSNITKYLKLRGETIHDYKQYIIKNSPETAYRLYGPGAFETKE